MAIYCNIINMLLSYYADQPGTGMGRVEMAGVEEGMEKEDVEGVVMEGGL